MSSTSKKTGRRILVLAVVNGKRDELEKKLARLITLSQHIESLFRLYDRQMNELASEILGMNHFERK